MWCRGAVVLTTRIAAVRTGTMFGGYSVDGPALAKVMMTQLTAQSVLEPPFRPIMGRSSRISSPRSEGGGMLMTGGVSTFLTLPGELASYAGRALRANSVN
jgi:hypothetical protein